MVREEDGVSARGRRLEAVQFSAGLLRQLSGKGKEPPKRKEPEEPKVSPTVKEPQSPPAAPQASLLPPMPPGAHPFGFTAAIPGPSRSSPYEHHSQRAKEVAEMREAVESSRSLADKLLLQESEELEKVKALAKDLHDKEYRAPSRPVPCQSEKDECVQCYVANSQDVLRCAHVVSDFVNCSRQAQQDSLPT